MAGVRWSLMLGIFILKAGKSTETFEPIATNLVTTAPIKTTPKHTPLKFLVRDQQDNQEYETYVGSKFMFNCSVSGYPVPVMEWSKDDEPIHDKSYRMFEHDMSQVFSITLTSLLTADSGKYKCIADNGHSRITTSLTLIVSENFMKQKPEIKYFSPRQSVIFVGESFRFNCTVSNVTDLRSPFIKWSRYSFFNATLFPSRNITNNNNNTTIVSTSTPSLLQNERVSAIKRMSNITHVEDGMVHQHVDLQLNQCEESYYEIKSATLRDTGEYTCRVFNEHGFSDETGYLRVISRPEPTREELEDRYIKTYNKGLNLPHSLAVIVGLPTFLIVVLVVGCVYVQARDQAAADRNKEAERQTALIIQKANSHRLPVINSDIHVQYTGGLPEPYYYSVPEKGSNASLAGSRMVPNEDEFTSHDSKLLIRTD